MNPIPARRARQGALLALLACVALVGACDGFFVEPGARPDDTGSLGLSLSAAGSGASTLLQSSNLLRVQLVRDGVVALDTVLDFAATDAGREVVLPLARVLTPATVLVEVELRTGRQAVLRGARSVQLSRRQVTTAEVDLVPTASPGLAPIAGISAGIFHSCALRDDGRAVCWGDGLYGQLGDGGTSSRLTPVAVGGDRAFRQVHAGFVSSCGVGTDRFAYCWGENDRGVLGIGDAARATLPTRVAGEIRFESLTMGGLHTCGLDADGRAFCWGYNRYGQLGNGTVTDSRVPVAAAPALRFRSLSAGYLHTCGVAMDRRTLCWGYNEYGQLGNGSTVDRTTPVQVSGLPAMETVDAGGLHTCSVAANGSAHCWGYNRWGQLGSAPPQEVQSLPVPVSGGVAFHAVVAGGGHTCGISQGTGQLSCWGYNHSGPLGTGGFANASAPTPVVGPQTARTFDVGLHHTCAVGPAGEALCWGFNRFGQLGDRSTVRAAAPGFVVDEETRPVAPASRSTVSFGALHRLLDHHH